MEREQNIHPRTHALPNEHGEIITSGYSVVIPARNAACTLCESLDSLVVQDAPHLLKEVIVVDDASADRTRSIAEKYQCRVICNPSRRGPAFSRNLGAREARTDRLIFMDADIVLSPDTVRRFDDAFRKFPDAAALVAARSPETRIRNPASRYKNYWTAYNWNCLTNPEVLNASAFCISRTKFLESGGFDERIQDAFYEDDELGARLVQNGNSIRVVHGIRVQHLKHFSLYSLLKRDSNTSYGSFIIKKKGLGILCSFKYSSVNWRFLIAFPLLVLSVLSLTAGALSDYTPLCILAGIFLAAVTAVNTPFWTFINKHENTALSLILFIPMFMIHVFCAGVSQLAGFVRGLAPPRKQ